MSTTSQRNVWHQTWLDTSGALLLLECGRHGDAIVLLEGQTIGKSGTLTRHRITWKPSADGSVRPFCESTDAAGQWKPASMAAPPASDAPDRALHSLSLRQLEADACAGAQ